VVTDTRPRTAAAALTALLRTAARVDRTQSDPVVALRNAIGVAAPLAVGAIAGNAAYGLPATIGALQTAFADRPGPYRLRLLRMSGAAVAVAVTSAFAVLLSGTTIGSALFLSLIGFAGGLLLSVGPSAAQVGVASTAAALLLGHQAEAPSAALHVALLVLAGGATQTLLAVSAWPLRRHLPERGALAGLYRQLADLARHPLGTNVGPPMGELLADVRATLYGVGHDHGPSVEAYRVLLDEAERIRRELLVLGGYADRLAREGDPAAAEAVRTALIASADALDGIATALDNGRAVPDEVLTPLRATVADAFEQMNSAGSTTLTRRAAIARLRGLVGQLRATLESSRTGASEGRRSDETAMRGPRLRDPFAILRANLTFASPVLRHALRLGLLVGGSDLVTRLAHVDRGYWVPLTVVVVLRPDFASTFQRSAMRMAGTIAGLALATALVHWIPGGQWYSVALVAVFFFGMRLAGPGNIALSALALSALVVILLGLAGVPAHTTVIARSLATVAGGSLALVAMLIWPVWERELVADRLGDLLRAYRGYTLDIADLTFDLARLQAARAKCRLARTNAQASVDRARAEPVPARAQVDLGEAVLVHTHRYIHALLAIDGLRPALRTNEPPPEFESLLHRAASVLVRCERTVRAGESLHGVTDLRDAQVAFVDALSNGTGLNDETAGALIDATDRLANSLDTLVSELRRQLETASGFDEH
jgi:uncharacterized membrane protein YccC